MKHLHSPRGGRLMSLILAVSSILPSAFAKDEIPRGTLNVDRTLVQVGTRSQLNWKIEYPTVVTDVIEITPPNIIKPKESLKMRVRVLGASFQESATKYLPVEVMWSKNNSSWARVFYGTQTVVNPTKIVLDTTVKKGDVINFGGRGYRNGWLPLYNTSVSTANLVMLKNGDKVPSTTPAFQQGLIESFLTPYLGSDKKTIKIGQRDLILLMELGQTNPAVSGFDLQDLVVLVTFE
jgi:hypothetical protein